MVFSLQSYLLLQRINNTKTQAAIVTTEHKQIRIASENRSCDKVTQSMAPKSPITTEITPPKVIIGSAKQANVKTRTHFCTCIFFLPLKTISPSLLFSFD